MMKLGKKSVSDRDKELFLGHVVTWGAIIFALVLAIVLARLGANENDPGASAPHAGAAPEDRANEQS